MKVLLVLVALFGSASLHAKSQVDMNDISCIEAAIGGPRGEFTGEQIHMILLSIENWWRQEFDRRGLPFHDVGYHVLNGLENTACGKTDGMQGPFYCGQNGFIYVNPRFFNTRSSMKFLGAPTQALLTFVLAHEFGHHIQFLLDVENRAERYNQSRYGGGFYRVNIDIGPQFEYQADCLAGVYLSQLYQRKLVTVEDLQENLQRMARLGDDYIRDQNEMEMRQRQSQQVRYRVPQYRLPWRWNLQQGYSHGTSAKRKEWMKKGLLSGTMNSCETFEFKSLN